MHTPRYLSSAYVAIAPLFWLRGLLYELVPPPPNMPIYTIWQSGKWHAGKPCPCDSATADGLGLHIWSPTTSTISGARRGWGGVIAVKAQHNLERHVGFRVQDSPKLYARPAWFSAAPARGALIARETWGMPPRFR